MPPLPIDLNEEDLHPIDWDEILEYDSPAHELAYDMVWEDANQGTDLLSFMFCLY